jgi:hypothetical protein
MDAPIPSLFGRVTVVLGEHADLYKGLKRLRVLCANLAAGERSADADALRAVNGFLDELSNHFAKEETGDYFGQLVDERPALRPDIHGLITEHRAMTEAGMRIEAAFTKGAPAAELAGEISRLLDALEWHERRENALLQQYFSPEKH